MPLSVATLHRQERPFDFNHLGETLHLTYRPGRITAESDAWPMPKWITEVIASWDLQGQDGEHYPLVLAEVEKLPDSFLVLLGKAVFADSRLDPSTSETSADG